MSRSPKYPDTWNAINQMIAGETSEPFSKTFETEQEAVRARNALNVNKMRFKWPVKVSLSGQTITITPLVVAP